MYQILELFFSWEHLLIWLIAGFALLYRLSTRNFDYFSSRGIPYVKPVPFFGNSLRSTLSFEPPHQSQLDAYNKEKDAPYVGTFSFTIPKLLLKDPELIEQVLITDFSSADDRGGNFAKDDGKGLTVHLLNMSGPRWKSLRNKLSPVFTSGKLKMMKDQFEVCSDRLADYLRKEMRTGEPLEAKYLMSGFTLDVIGSCAFGLEFNAISDPNSNFRKMGDVTFAPSKFKLLFTSVKARFPLIMKFISFFMPAPPIDTQEYIKKLVSDTVKYREDNNIIRNDFVQLMMEIKKNDKEKNSDKNEVLMDDRVMASNSLVFLLAGYETTASTLSFMLYELAVNQDVQERLYQEIVQVLKKHNGDLSWECLKDMNYLQQVISETQRKHPPAIGVTRQTVKPFKLKKYDLVAPPGLQFTVPIFSLHHDPKYFPDPEKFDPERFSEENKHKIVKCTYLPFGDGPRICIGMRFALMEIKMAITKLLLEFSVTLNPKTISPLQYSPGTFLLAPVGGIWLDFAARNGKSKAA